MVASWMAASWQFRSFDCHFADFGQVKKICHFADFGQVKNIVILLTLRSQKILPFFSAFGQVKKYCYFADFG